MLLLMLLEEPVLRVNLDDDDSVFYIVFSTDSFGDFFGCSE